MPRSRRVPPILDNHRPDVERPPGSCGCGGMTCTSFQRSAEQAANRTCAQWPGRATPRAVGARGSISSRRWIWTSRSRLRRGSRCGPLRRQSRTNPSCKNRLARTNSAVCCSRTQPPSTSKWQARAYSTLVTAKGLTAEMKSDLRKIEAQAVFADAAEKQSVTQVYLEAIDLLDTRMEP